MTVSALYGSNDFGVDSTKSQTIIPSKLMKFLALEQKNYPTLYGVNDQYMPQISFEIKGSLDEYFEKLQHAVGGEYEIKKEKLPKGEVISLLPRRKTLCRDHKLCELSTLDYILKRFEKMRLLSFTRAFDRYWGSLQESAHIRKSTQNISVKSFNLFNTELTHGLETSFIMKDMKTSSINGKSSLNFEKAMKKFDHELTKSGVRLGSIKAQAWEEVKTLSGLYKIGEDSVFILVQENKNGSLVQVQQTSKVTKNEIRKILTKNKLIY